MSTTASATTGNSPNQSKVNPSAKSSALSSPVEDFEEVGQARESPSPTRLQNVWQNTGVGNLTLSAASNDDDNVRPSTGSEIDESKYPTPELALAAQLFEAQRQIEEQKAQLRHKDQDLQALRVQASQPPPLANTHRRRTSLMSQTSIFSPVSSTESANTSLSALEEMAALKAQLLEAERKIAQLSVETHDVEDRHLPSFIADDRSDTSLSGRSIPDIDKHVSVPMENWRARSRSPSCSPRSQLNSNAMPFWPQSASTMVGSALPSPAEVQAAAFGAVGAPRAPASPGRIWGSRPRRTPSMSAAPPVSAPFLGAHGRSQSASSFGSMVNAWNYPGSRGSDGSSPGLPPQAMPAFGNMTPPLNASFGGAGGFPSPDFVPSTGPWANPGNSFAQQSPNTIAAVILPTDTVNWRRLLQDRMVIIDWNVVVDRIVCNNDQQASIFLQQKLKMATSEQRHAIIEAIIAQAYPLMLNRFGNFLVQRCFEYGTPEQVKGIADAIRGNVLNLSCDNFGCHVVQKAFDCVDEDDKASMVTELLRRIPETVIHRSACHVWQKLFEIRWEGSPPVIMPYVNKALKGEWHTVALGETGSLVVQNIFENCLEEDKRECIDEVIAKLDTIARGQWGNWVVQHIVEHGDPNDRQKALDVIMENAVAYSMDQFASKIIEKMLKVCEPPVVARYLERITEAKTDRPRVPLIDIASDMYGNYLIQYMIDHCVPAQREIIVALIRKHLVSLRGSRFGSRVALKVGHQQHYSTSLRGPNGGWAGRR
ncbi:ARM repeat-containing protein [Saitoella complicata NRRL Y-17804]|uniref:PUM-HD domain-containing protein n=1 Tax=Saitoella complicata (strain BCRC 22490 / CBS 7301 / JCM 7358 / NBRC 10748 / NRRL Y-17804) TaxID=698492 RepID=A0A0E9N9C0_SAICN|nr:ARM repeat-containing protein [Saitoella complicata NRRL Y-17804]ODQ53284.1 ARM repeat-containing protein [Saitoella complicata NRRL Y-17804]GAO46409.1 hypothetical protein G7K_0640-t1 [Saitoella complicata NRRL Y-17804]